MKKNVKCFPQISNGSYAASSFEHEYRDGYREKTRGLRPRVFLSFMTPPITQKYPFAIFR